MDDFTFRLGKCYGVLEKALVTSRTRQDERRLRDLFEQFMFVGFYFYNDRSMLCQAFNDYLCKFTANEATIVESIDAKLVGDDGSQLALLAVVCIFPDEGQLAFQQAVAKVPWFALDYQESAARAALLRLFRVRRLPCFSLVETADRVVCSADCCLEMQEDTAVQKFPWKPKVVKEIFTGSLLAKNGRQVSFETMPAGYKGLLFAAQWCPPCRTFVKKLIEVYKHLKTSQNEFEVVFCSRDRSLEAFKRFYADMPWLAIPFNDSRLQHIAKALHVQEIPSFLILDENYAIVNRYGKLEVLLDPLAKEFPWHPRSVIEMSEKMLSRLREDVAFILFTEGTNEDLQFAQNVLLPIAEEHFQHGREPEIIFFYAPEDVISEKLLESFGLQDCALPLICISDPFSEMLYISDHPNVSEEVIRTFLNNFESNQLSGKAFCRPQQTVPSLR